MVKMLCCLRLRKKPSTPLKEPLLPGPTNDTIKLTRQIYVGTGHEPDMFTFNVPHLDQESASDAAISCLASVNRGRVIFISGGDLSIATAVGLLVVYYAIGIHPDTLVKHISLHVDPHIMVFVSQFISCHAYDTSENILTASKPMALHTSVMY